MTLYETIEERTIIPPPNGWLGNSYYIVEMSLRPNNPVFSAIFYTGFLNGDDISEESIPGRYNYFMSDSGPVEADRPKIGMLRYHDVHYLKPIHLIAESKVKDGIVTAYQKDAMDGPFKICTECGNPTLTLEQETLSMIIFVKSKEARDRLKAAILAIIDNVEAYDL